MTMRNPNKERERNKALRESEGPTLGRGYCREGKRTLKRGHDEIHGVEISIAGGVEKTEHE